MGAAVKSSALIAVPTLDTLVRDPAQARLLSGHVRGELMAQASAVIACLAAPMIAEAPASAPEADALLTAKEMAARLKVKESWILTEARRGRIPKVLIGRYVRFSAEAVERALAQCPAS
jgi:excisionase family DNA binding protein